MKLQPCPVPGCVHGLLTVNTPEGTKYRLCECSGGVVIEQRIPDALMKDVTEGIVRIKASEPKTA